MSAGPTGDLRGTVGGFLRASYGEVPTDSYGDFVVRHDGTLTWVRVDSASRDRAGILVTSVVNVGAPVGTDLTRFLATAGGNLALGQFALHEGRTPEVRISHRLLAEGLSREALEVALEAVASASRYYSPIIKERFGGRLFSESALGRLFTGIPEGPTGVSIWNRLMRPTTVGDYTRALRLLLRLAALASPFVAARYAYNRTSSWEVAVFAFAMTLYLVARGVRDVLPHDEKVKRALYFAMTPAAGTGVLYASYRLWGDWWLSVLLGFVGGWLLGSIVSTALLPKLAREHVNAAKRRRGA